MPSITLLQKGHLVSDDPKDAEIIPLDYIREHILRALSKSGLENRILVLKSSTGSGKSTALPPMLYKNFKSKQTILVTQPRVMNAINIVRDQITSSGFYPYMKRGENIGWSTGKDKLIVPHGVLYTTLGVFIQQLAGMDDKKIINKYSFIMIDEVHEASLEQSRLLMMLRNFYLRNANDPKIPYLILTSATLEKNKLMEYFNTTAYIEVRGFTQPLTHQWDYKIAPNNYMMEMAKKAITTHYDNPNDEPTNCDILCFLPGEGEIREVESFLTKELVKHKEPYPIIIKLTSRSMQNYNTVIQPINQLKTTINNRTYNPTRKIILGTNVIETGVTIDTLKYVLDSGYMKQPEYNPHLDCHGLITKPISQARAEQRKGRANRKSPGVYIPIFSHDTYNILDKNQMADILIHGVNTIILPLMVDHEKGGHNINEPIQTIDQIPQDIMAMEYERLYNLGFISPYSTWSTDYNPLDSSVNVAPHIGITRMGHLASMFTKIPPEAVRMIMSSYAWNVNTLDVITIAAYLTILGSSPKGFMLGRNDIQWWRIYKKGTPLHFTYTNILDMKDIYAIMRTRFLISDDMIDGLILFHAFKKAISDKTINAITAESWCTNLEINYQTMLAFIDMRADIIADMLKIGLNPFYNYESSFISIEEENFINYVVALKYCIYDGYRNNLAIWDNSKSSYIYRGVEVNTPPRFSPTEANIADQKKYGDDILKPAKYIIHSGCAWKFNKNTGMYSLECKTISVMDGFVSIDI